MSWEEEYLKRCGVDGGHSCSVERNQLKEGYREV